MKETEYVLAFEELFRVPGESFRVVLEAIAFDLPLRRRQALAEPLEPLVLKGTFAPDFALVSDVGIDVFEFKAPGTNVNATRISTVLASGLEMGTDELALRIRRSYKQLEDLSGAGASHDDAGLRDGSCGCVVGQYDRSQKGHHFPGVYQGDAYRLFLPGVPPEYRPADLSEVGYIFMAPNEKAAQEWRHAHVSAEAWSVVRLDRVVARLRPHGLVDRHIRDWIRITEEFIGIEPPEAP